jgi:hypothetical protein
MIGKKHNPTNIAEITTAEPRNPIFSTIVVNQNGHVCRGGLPLDIFKA